MPRRQSEKAFLMAYEGQVAPEGRKFLVVGPFCWGKGKTVAEAVKNAKSNRVRSYEGKEGWRFFVCDVIENAYVDDMGGIRWTVEKGQNVDSGYREIGRFNLPEKKEAVHG